MRQVDSDGPLLVGWAARDITPDRPVNLAGQLYARVTDQVLDPLTVTALALLDSSFSQAVIILKHAGASSGVYPIFSPITWFCLPHTRITRLRRWPM